MPEQTSEKLRKAIEEGTKTGAVNLESCGLTAIPEGVLSIENLLELNISNNNISDLDLLKKIPTLKFIRCEKNDIQSLEVINDLPNLSLLRAGGNSIESLHICEKLSYLETLDLSDNPLESVAGFENMAGLIEINLSGCNIEDWSFFEQFDLDARKKSGSAKNMRIDLSGNKIRVLDFLTSLHPLEELRLNKNKISSIWPLNKLTALKSLYLNENRISDISGIEGLQSLETLSLQENRIEELSYLQNLTELVRLWLDSNLINSCEHLSALERLTTLSLSHNQIQSTMFIERLRDLTSLDLSHNPIDRLDAFWNLSDLKRLNVSNTRIETISHLDQLVKNILERDERSISFDISNNNITSFKPFIPLVRIGIGINWENGTGEGIYCHGNDWKEPNTSIMKRGRTEILKNEISLKFLILYSEDDEIYFNEIEKILRIFNRTFIVEILNMEMPGQDKEDYVKILINEADFIVPLVSNDYLSHSFLCDLVENAISQGKFIVPIPVRPFHMVELKILKKSPLIPWKSPISISKNKDESWTSVTSGFDAMIKRHIEKNTK